jgi:hypothetical protein
VGRPAGITTARLLQRLVIAEALNTLSPDGRTMTITVEGTTPESDKYLSVLVVGSINHAARP